MVNFERVEWVVEPDPATAAAALQTGEVDWIEFPLIDLLPTLAKAPGCKVETFDPLGALAMVAFNHLYPPFNNPKILEALLPAIDQKEYVTAWVGEQASLGKYPVGFFTDGSPMANTVGLDALTSPRDPAKAKQLLKEAGYNGEKVILMSPSDQPSLTAMCQVTRSVFQKVGINVDYQSMDWGTLVSRRASMNPPDKGGWNVFCTTWGGLQVSNPGSSYPLRGNGRKGWFGWPTNPKIESLRQQWFDMAGVPAQKKICEQIQTEAFKSIPFMPAGQWFYPVAYRNDLTGFVKNSQIVFWGVKRA